MGVPTAGTPRGVMEAAARALRTCLMWSMILLLFALGALGLIYFLAIVVAD